VSDENQIVVPPAFIALYVPPGRVKPTESRDFILQRHELCEDMACMLTETAQTQLWQLSITEALVLERVHRGLQGGTAGLNAAEADWVVHRLAELLEWPDPELAQPAPWPGPESDGTA
jgi:hypothetical protein